MKPDVDNSYFIDRDSTYFRLVLNYLRDLKVNTVYTFLSFAQILTLVSCTKIPAGVVDDHKM